MKHNLKDTTFIIPIRIESEDRLRNIITVCCYLLETFDTNIIVKEVDDSSVFMDVAYPQIKEYVGDYIDNLIHIFERKDPNDNVFYRMRYINEMISLSNTKVIANYDVDVLLPVETCLASQSSILEGGADVVYPYGKGMWQKRIFADDALVSEFLSNDCDFSILEKKSDNDLSDSGHVQFLSREVYVEGGMENENFRGPAPEDKERLYRFTTLGYNVVRLNTYVYHLEHSRGANSYPVAYTQNPFMRDNMNLWDYLSKLSREELREYYNNQKYLKKYK